MRQRSFPTLKTTPPEVGPLVPTVLIVDDVWISADLSYLILEQKGYRSHVVYSGREALEWLDKNYADVVLCDLRMPDMSGHEVAKAIFDKFGAARPRLVAYTAYRREAKKIALSCAGFDDLIEKPARVEVLAATIKYWAEAEQADLVVQ